MVVLQHNSPTDSNATEGDETTNVEADDGTPDPSVVDRLVSAAEKIATVIEPFAALLTAVVQAATVATLVRKA
jgi:hypothetical protein